MVPDGQEVPQIHNALPAPSTRMSSRLHASCLIAHTPEPPKNKLSVSGLETSRWVDTGRQAVNGCGSVGLAAESSLWQSFSLRVVTRGDSKRLFDDHRLHLNKFARGRCAGSKVMRAAQQNSLETLKILSQLPPTTGFLSTRECYTRGLPRVLREAQHFFRQWRAT